MFITILIVVVAIAGVLVLLLARPGRDKAGWIQFYAKGKEAGFSLKEIDHLRRLATKSNIDDPVLIFSSQEHLDVCIRFQVRTMHLSGGGDDLGLQDFLSRLYDFRKRIELEKPVSKHGISNSRQITDGQSLRILVKGSGVFRSQIVKNTSNYITISRPTSAKMPATFSWQGVDISVYFWREDDAGYVFDSQVTDEVYSKGIASLKISHSNSLFRTQKRKSIRIKIHKPAYIYPLTDDDEGNVIEANPGLKCFLNDLSDTGAAILIGGKAMSGLRIKIQFSLNGFPIVMSGTVRSVDYKEDVNKSILRMEADPLPIEVRNQILGEVFGMLPEEEEDLPFRLLGEEAEEMTSGLGPIREESGAPRRDSDMF